MFFFTGVELEESVWADLKGVCSVYTHTRTAMVPWKTSFFCLFVCPSAN